MRARLIASSALAVLSFSSFSVAFAEETPMTIDTLAESLKNLSCAEKQGKAIGTCISDVLKRIKTIEHDFALQYKEDVKVWRAAHDGEGISKEYTVAQKQFNDMMQEKRRVFQEQVRLIRKAFFDQQNLQRVQKGEVNTKGSQELTTSSETDARKACVSWDNDEDEVRVCLRNALQRKAAVDKRLQTLRAKVKALEEKQKAAGVGVSPKISQ